MPFHEHYQNKGYRTPSKMQGDDGIAKKPIAACYLHPRMPDTRLRKSGLFADTNRYTGLSQALIEIDFYGNKTELTHGTCYIINAEKIKYARMDDEWQFCENDPYGGYCPNGETPTRRSIHVWTTPGEIDVRIAKIQK